MTDRPRAQVRIPFVEFSRRTLEIRSFDASQPMTSDYDQRSIERRFVGQDFILPRQIENLPHDSY